MNFDRNAKPKIDLIGFDRNAKSNGINFALAKIQGQKDLVGIKPDELCPDCGGNGQNEDESLCKCVTTQIDKVVAKVQRRSL